MNSIVRVFLPAFSYFFPPCKPCILTILGEKQTPPSFFKGILPQNNFILKTDNIGHVNSLNKGCLKKLLKKFGRNCNLSYFLVAETMSLLYVQSKVCMAPFNVWSKVCKFAPHMDGSNADIAPHMEGRHADIFSGTK